MIQKIKEFAGFLKDFFINRRLILKLSKNDIKSRYAGNLFGIIWAFVQPLVTLLVFWFVFQVGFKNPPVNDIAFILWLIPAYIPWIYFSDAVLSSSNCMYEYAYLVKKIRFRTSLLPIVKVISSTFIHLFFIVFIWFIYLVYGHPFKLLWLQCIYYTFALFCLEVGISWIVSSISVFFKDFSQIVNIMLQIGFWLTPIFWSPEQINSQTMTILKINPLYYITQGYRDSFITGIGFWQRGYINLYYWSIIAIVFIAGALIYKRLRPHFADMI